MFLLSPYHLYHLWDGHVAPLAPLLKLKISLWSVGVSFIKRKGREGKGKERDKKERKRMEGREGKGEEGKGKKKVRLQKNSSKAASKLQQMNTRGPLLAEMEARTLQSTTDQLSCIHSTSSIPLSPKGFLRAQLEKYLLQHKF